MSTIRERLNNAEIIELIPELPFEQVVMFDVKLLGKWLSMLDVSKTDKSAMCYVCNRNFQSHHFLTHWEDEQHLSGLKKVEQFYHPAYTYPKTSERLAKGLKVTQEELNVAIKKADEALAATTIGFPFDMKVIGKDMPLPLPLKEQLRLVKKHKDLVLDAEDLDPRNTYVMSTLSLDDMQGIEFTNDGTEWKPLIRTQDWAHHSKFDCLVCSKTVAGLTCMNEHLNGVRHKTLQFKTVGVRVRNHHSLTKNCIFRSSSKYSLRFPLVGKQYVLKKLQEQNNDDATDGANGCKENNEDTGDNVIVLDGGEVEVRTPISTVANKVIKNLSNPKSKTLKEEKPNVMAIANADNKGLIGVEYVIMATKFAKDPNPEFECCLCKFNANGIGMQVHLTSECHRLKYCDINYPDTMRKYEQDLSNIAESDRKRVLAIILAKLALSIENHHGRSLPYTYPAQKLRHVHDEIVAKAYTFLHACQEHGPSFTNLFSKDDIIELGMRKDIRLARPLPTKPPAFLTTPTSTFYLNLRSHDPDKRPKMAINLPLARTEMSSKKTLENRENRKQRDDVRSKPQPMKAPAVMAVESAYKEYRRNPEKHPLYDKEWDLFWRKRKQELVAEGVNYRTYNFQPEWVVFFRARLEELCSEDMANAIPRQKESYSPNIVNARNHPSQEFVLDSDNRMDNFPVPPKRPRLAVPSQMAEDWREFNEQVEMSEKQQVYETVIRDNKSNIVHGLRILVALEDHLGSLGGKMTELLSQALIMEKTCTSNEELEKYILTAQNCTMLETAMEKLKGIVYAGFLEPAKLPGVNRVIQNTENMLRYADDMGFGNNLQPVFHSNTNSVAKQQSFEQANLPSMDQTSLSNTLMSIMSSQNDPMPESARNFPQSSRVSGPPRMNRHIGGGGASVGAAVNNNNNNNYDGNSKQYSTFNETGLSSFNTRLDLSDKMYNPSGPAVSDRSIGYNMQSNPIGQSGSNIDMFPFNQQNRPIGIRRGDNNRGSGGYGNMPPNQPNPSMNKNNQNFNRSSQGNGVQGEGKWIGYNGPYYSW